MLTVGTDNPSKVVILLHGLGAQANDLVPVAEQLCQVSPTQVQCCLPSAPSRELSLYPGTEITAWYDFSISGIERVVNEDHLGATVASINALIDSKIAEGIPSSDIFLLGFSQGGAIAYATAMSTDRKLGGVFALSAYIPNPASRAAPVSLRETPFCIYHGTEDDVVPCALADMSMTWLKQKGVGFEFSQYTMAHTICLGQMRDIQNHFSNLLKAP